MDISHPQSELPKISIFPSTKKYLTILGISPNLMVQPYPFNRNISIGFLICASGIICIFVYIYFDAKTFLEFTQAIYYWTDTIICAFALAILVFRTSHLFNFIVSLENVLNDSECKLTSFHS